MEASTMAGVITAHTVVLMPLWHVTLVQYENICVNIMLVVLFKCTESFPLFSYFLIKCWGIKVDKTVCDRI